MDQARALQLVTEVRYKAGWTIAAEPGRSEDYIQIRADFVAPDSSKQYAPDYRVTTTVHSIGVINLTSVGSDLDLLRQVLNFLIEVETHDAREFFRQAPGLDAPFHPHFWDGEKAWQITKNDFHYGLPSFDLPDFTRPIVE